MVSFQDGNVAFKCAWNDAQYKGKCNSCPNTNPSCAQKWIHVTPKECWERHIFENWEFGVGENKHIIQAKEGKMVVFTTKKPSSDHRSIFGIARIEKIEKERHYPAYDPFPASWSDMVHIDPNLSVAIPDSIDISFGDFYKTQWNIGLFRYLSDDVVKKILFRTERELQKIGYNQEELDKLEKLTHLL